MIHRLPCLRYILAEAVICRAEGVVLTHRWTGTEIQNIPSDIWAPEPNDLRTISVKFSSYSQPLTLVVRKFIPDPNLDNTHRTWKDRDGNFHRIPIPPYALRDAQEAASTYYRYIYTHMFPAMEEFVRNKRNNSLVRETYKLV